MVARKDPPWETAWQYMARVNRTLGIWKVGHEAVVGEPTPNARRALFISRIRDRRELMPGLRHIHKPGRSLRLTARGKAPTKAQFEANPGEHIAALLERGIPAVIQPKWRTLIDSGYGWGRGREPARGWSNIGALHTRSVSTRGVMAARGCRAAVRARVCGLGCGLLLYALPA